MRQRRFRLQVFLSATSFLPKHRCRRQRKNLNVPLLLAAYAIEIGLQNSLPATDMRLERFVVEEFYSETCRQNVRGQSNRGKDQLVPRRGFGKPIKILHILREIQSELGFGHPADPADEAAASNRFHGGGSIDALKTANIFGGWYRG